MPTLEHPAGLPGRQKEGEIPRSAGSVRRSSGLELTLAVAQLCLLTALRTLYVSPKDA